MNKLPSILLCSITVLATACAVQSSSESKTDCPGAPQQVGASSTIFDAPEHIVGTWTVRQIDTLALSDSIVSYPVMEFREEGRVNATAGCNTLSGAYTYAEASLTFSDKLCQTLMLCPEEEIARNEQLLAQAMDSVLTVTSCGSDSLRLQGKHSMLLVKTNQK